MLRKRSAGARSRLSCAGPVSVSRVVSLSTDDADDDDNDDDDDVEDDDDDDDDHARDTTGIGFECDSKTQLMSHDFDNREPEATDNHSETHGLHTAKNECLDAFSFRQGPHQVAIPSKSFD